MNLSRRIYRVILLFVLVIIISIIANLNSTYIFKNNKIQISTTLIVNKVTQHLEYQQRLEAQKEKNLKIQGKQEESTKQQKASSKNQTSSSKLIQSITPPAKPNPELLINRIKVKGNVQQAIIVTTNGFDKVNATITTFENIDGKWKKVATFAGNIGRKGFTYNKIEGNEHSPIGIFSLGTAFGRYSNPGTKMYYKQSTLNDFWVNDVNSPLYNTWQEGPVNKRWTSAENMYIPQYNYGFVINYNTTKRIPGKGSAIFFHVWSGAGHGTEGCTATAQNNVLSILKWLKPSENPVIIEGPISEVVKM